MLRERATALRYTYVSYHVMFIGRGEMKLCNKLHRLDGNSEYGQSFVHLLST